MNMMLMNVKTGPDYLGLIMNGSDRSKDPRLLNTSPKEAYHNIIVLFRL